jgi:hypothetical protein
MRPYSSSSSAFSSHRPAQDKVVRHLNQIDLSRRWGVSPRTLERWRWRGEGPAYVKLGGRVVYRLEDIEAFEAAQLRKMPAADLR